MKVTKIEVTEANELEKLVVDHIDRIEPGLSVIDSRPMLGHATIDLVAQDAAGSLVLIALGFRAEENMLLGVVDAYSWCLEYPGTMQRHYPAVAVSEERPPRVVFIMSRVPEAFQRKIKQLSFPSVDAVEFHHIDVDGESTVFFDPIARIRRGVAAVAPAPVAPVPTIAVRSIQVPPPAPRAVVETAVPTAEPVRLAAEIAVLLGKGTAIAGGSDAQTVEIESLVAEPDAPAAELELPVAEPVEAVETPEPVEPVAAAAAPEAEPTAENKYLFSEAAKATKIAEELGIKLPNDGPLTREWIDFLNQMAAK
jgi:hypothetical protein